MVLMIKRLGKAFLCRVLERQVCELRDKNDFKIIAVGGSVGKTSTKLAIAKTLAASKRTIYQDGNYNDRLTVPLVLFGEVEPSIFNVFAWMALLGRTRNKTISSYPYDIAVLEIGTDAPGQMEQFSYLKPDLYVLSSIAPEHMVYFDGLDAVAEEELQPVKFSKQILINIDDTPLKYLPAEAFTSYGFDTNAEYKITDSKPLGLMGQDLTVSLAGEALKVKVSALGKQGGKLILAAAASAHKMGVSTTDIAAGLQKITPVAGRMQVLAGTGGSSLIDDTYNSSPVAVKAALDVLYGAEAAQKIAILGSMNEMGDDSAGMHAEIGTYCDPDELQLVVTVGKEAQQYLAPAAEKAGCTIKSFASPYEAGEFVKSKLQKGAVVLAKGSQNGVFAEEALKTLLANQADQSKLVRQSPRWLDVKRRQFDAG
jgi:UDP-N-acetylmuramoyl-tripeptide--D-alanyl-D-alanine ligase